MTYLVYYTVVTRHGHPSNESGCFIRGEVIFHSYWAFRSLFAEWHHMNSQLVIYFHPRHAIPLDNITTLCNVYPVPTNRITQNLDIVPHLDIANQSAPLATVSIYQGIHLCRPFGWFRHRLQRQETFLHESQPLGHVSEKNLNLHLEYHLIVASLLEIQLYRTYSNELD